jgi:hypothetical protein
MKANDPARDHEGELMPKRILMEQFLLSMTAPAGLHKGEYDAMLRTLKRKRFLASLRNAVREVARRYPSLRKAHVALER